MNFRECLLMKHPTISRKNNEKKERKMVKSSEPETEKDSRLVKLRTYIILKQPPKN